MRGSDPDAAVYYLVAMLEGGEDPRFIARRMIILASEDVGNADPQALVVAVAAAHALEHVGLPEAKLNLTQAAIYLARAPKSNAVYARSRPPPTESASTATSARRRSSATRTAAARRSSATARATSTRTTTRPASRSTTSRRSSRGARSTSRRRRAEEARVPAAAGGDRRLDSRRGPGPGAVRGVLLRASNGARVAGADTIYGQSVVAVTGDGQGGWFIGGEFWRIGTRPRTNLAHLDRNGRLVQSWRPVVDGTIASLARTGRTLYLAGSFRHVDGVAP